MSLKVSFPTTNRIFWDLGVLRDIWNFNSAFEFTTDVSLKLFIFAGVDHGSRKRQYRKLARFQSRGTD